MMMDEDLKPLPSDPQREAMMQDVGSKKEYHLKAETGFLFDPSQSMDMNDVVKLAETNGFVREAIQIQSSMGIMNIFAWQKDVMNAKFWFAIGDACGWKNTIVKSERFFQTCIHKSWNEAVDELIKIIKQTQNG